MLSPIEQVIDAVLQPIPGVEPSASGLPYATHFGVLELAPGVRLDVYRLSNGQAVVGEEGMAAFLQFIGIHSGSITTQEA